MLMPKCLMRVYCKRLPNGKLQAKVTSNNLASGETVFEGTGYADEATLLVAIQFTGMIPKDICAAGVELVYAAKA